jgi:hypothetical protein
MSARTEPCPPALSAWGRLDLAMMCLAACSGTSSGPLSSADMLTVHITNSPLLSILSLSISIHALTRSQQPLFW